MSGAEVKPGPRLKALVLSLDEALFLRIGAFRPGWAVGPMKALTHLGDAPSWIAIGLFLLCGGAVRAGTLLGAAAVLATVVSQVLKRSWKRPRSPASTWAPITRSTSPPEPCSAAPAEASPGWSSGFNQPD